LTTFSIIIPAFNVELYLKQALDSLIQQTYGDFEALIINDGSTDNTAEIATSYAKADKRFICFNQINSGVSVSRNVGLAYATGKYIYFLDGDDLIVKNALEIMFATFTKYHCDIYFFSAQTFGNIALTVNDYERIPSVNALYAGQYLIEYINRKFVVSSSCYVMARSSVGDQRFVNNLVYEDNIFIFKLISKNIIIYADNKKLFFRRIRLGSIMTSAMTLFKYYSLIKVAKAVCAIKFDNIDTTLRSNLRFWLASGYFGNVCFGSSRLGCLLNVKIRLINLKLLFEIAKIVGIKFVTPKRILLAIIPEIYINKSK